MPNDEDEADLDFDGYVTARAEYEADQEAFQAELLERMERARQDATARLRACGALPAGLELVWETK
jgi:TPP-dependent trihydroxycyclohexane-1,2-dione (THcHDO) dehydratase